MKLLALVSVVLLLLTPAFARPQKFRVNDATAAAELKSQGARLLADYGAFQLFQLDTPPAVALKSVGLEAADASDFIELNAGRLDTRAAEVVSLRKTVPAFAGRRLHLVQFVGPVKPEWRAALEATGVTVIHYIPENSYLIQGASDALTKFQSWAQTADFVQWEGPYADDYKIDPAARTVDQNGNPLSLAAATYSVQLVADDEANAVTLAFLDQIKLAPMNGSYYSLNYLNLTVQIPTARLAELVARPEVVSVHPYLAPHRRDERQDQIMAGNLSGSLPSGPGYLAWLTSKGFTQAQFDASGFVVDVSDSGIDIGTTNPNHFGLHTSGNPSLASRVAYARLEGSPNTGSTLQGCDGHGTLNSHIIAGFNNITTSPHLDAAGYHHGLGVAPFVRVGSSVIFDPDTFTSPNYPNLQARAYRDGARISNNSWGSSTSGAYNTTAQAYDSLVRDAQPATSAVATSGNQEMVIVFAAGNDGPTASSVGAPGTAKNVIVVGASENVHSHATASGGNDSTGSDGCSTVDTEADSANDMATFSSRGPCTDGRVKPDLVAPGTHITGGVAQTSLTTNGTGSAIACFDGTGVCGLPGSGTTSNPDNFFPLGQQFYTTSSGTSHATPGVSGACALLRQYFINASLTPPSPAMTKAFLVNSARYLTGTGAAGNLPSSSQGMGGVNLGTAFDGVSRLLRDELPADKFTAAGQVRTFNGSVVDSGKPFRVTLAWTDAPGSTSGNAYVNNLDLTVTVGGNTYKGNVFSGANSTTGGTADAKNNLESVFIPAGVTGTFVVTVTAVNIAADGVPNDADPLDQDFALVAYNASTTSAPVIGNNPQPQTVAVGNPASFTVGVAGSAPFGYQWYFNTAPIAAATNSTFNINSVQAGDAGNYFVIVTNNFGSATSSVAALTVVVAPVILTNPASLTVVTGSTAGFSVTAIGAPPLAYQWQFNGAEIAGAINSSYSIPSASTNDAGLYAVVVTNSSGSVTSSPATLTVLEGAAPKVVISQIYGGGGNAGGTYRNDFVELFNPGSAPASVAGWSVQYAAAANSTWALANLSGSIPPNSYYLVQLASGGSTGSVLPVANATNTAINISASNGKIALVTNQVALTVANPAGAAVVSDFVGYGTANGFEGSAAAPAGANALAILRNNNGATDTDDNAADFATGTPNPRATIVTNPPPAASIDLAVALSHSGTFTQGDAAATYSILVTNVGSLATTGTVSVVDTLPAGLTATALTGTGWTTTLGTLTATRSDVLATNAAYPLLTLTVSVATNAPASVTNLITVSTGGDTNTLNNTAADITSIIATNTGGNGVGYTGVLIGWDVSGQSTYGVSPLTPTTNAPNLTTIGLTRGAGVTTVQTAAARAWGGNGFDAASAAAAVTAGDYATFGLAANAGYKVSFSSLSRFDYRRSTSGPSTGVVQYQVGAGGFVSFATNSYSSTSSSGAVLPALDLTGIAALQDIGPGTNVTFRIVNYGATLPTGPWYIYDQANSTALDFALTGSVTPLAGPAASAPTLTLLSLVGAEVQFTLTGTVGSNYIIEATTNLPANNWIPVRTGAAPILYSEPATNAALFYRGKVQ